MAGSRRRSASVAANPVLIGAVTSLIVVIAVFLAYNANKGLPFVPNYEVSVRLPDAAELVVGNDVRKDGARVGQIAKLVAVRTPEGAYADATLTLQKDAGPLPADTTAVVRQRSSLGLKYLEIDAGASPTMVATGGVLKNTGAAPAVDLDDVLGTFDTPTREGIDQLLGGLGPGLAGRGGDLNLAFEQLPSTLRYLAPVMANLAAPGTDLPGFLRSGSAAMAVLAPVAPQLGSLLDDGATTLTALDDPPAIDATLRAAATNFRPIGSELRAVLPDIASARHLLTALRPALRRLPRTTRVFGDGVQRVTPSIVAAKPTLVAAAPTLRELKRTLVYPQTSTALRQLAALSEAAVPTLAAVNPFQTRCNYLGLWTRNVVGFISEGDSLGTWFRATPVIQTDEMLARAAPAPQMHYDPYPDAGQGGTCAAGNTAYQPGRQVLGHSGVTAPDHTENTSRPAGL